jgi:hypothetical protein
MGTVLGLGIEARVIDNDFVLCFVTARLSPAGQEAVTVPKAGEYVQQNTHDHRHAPGNTNVSAKSGLLF